MIQFFITTPLPAVLRDVDLETLGISLGKALRLKKKAQVSLSFVNEATIQALNTRYRGKRKSTDVLSFTSTPLVKSTAKVHEAVDQGDVFICQAYAKREAKRRGIPLEEELLRLVIHGVLHVHGYDHVTEAQEMRMFGLQERILSTFLVSSV